MSTKKFQTAVLHFGADKTGSSSIQSACDTYRDLLERNGIYYPSGVWHNELASCVSVNPENEIANIVYGYTDIDWIKKRDTEYLSNLCNELNQKEGKYLIFSNENFCFLDQKSVQNLYEFALQFAEECKILMYVRSPESYATSGMSQRVKMGFDPWEPPPIANAYHILNALEKICDLDKIIVRSFDRKTLYIGDVVADFLSFFQLDSAILESISKNVPKENTSLSLEAKIIGEKIIHKVSSQKLTSLAFMEKFQNILESIEGQKIQLSQQQADEIKHITKSHTDYLKAKFGIAFPEPNQNYQTGIVTIPDETAESIAKIIVDLVSPEFKNNKRKEITSSEFQLSKAVLKEGYEIINGQTMCFEVEFALDRKIVELEAGIHIWDSQKRWAFGTNSTLQKQLINNIDAGIYRISHYCVADLPEGVYTAGFAFAEKLPDGSINELMWYDELCKFRVSHPAERVCVGYANLPSMIALIQIDLLEKNLIFDGSGRIDSMSLPAEMKSLEYINIDVEIHNDTDMAWRGDLFRPINLSYHWLDENGDYVLFDGIRSPIPIEGVPAKGSVLSPMKIMAPQVEGNYRLVLTMVQESIGWLEDRGFSPYIMQIKVNKG